MRFRNWARMMQPPRQIFDTAPRSIDQLYSAAPARISSKPCEYATIFEAYSARRTSSMNASASSANPVAELVDPVAELVDRVAELVEASGPGRSRETSRCSGWLDSDRANVASAMPETGVPRLSAVCTVQAPVPLAPAWSRITSTSGAPVAASVCL